MSRPAGTKDLSEGFQEFLTVCAKIVFGLGLCLTLGSVAILVYTCYRLTGDSSLAAEALKNIDLFRRILIVGAVADIVGSTYLFWGEEVLAAIQLLFAAALYCAPLYVPSLLGSSTTNEAAGEALGALQTGGVVLGSLAACALVAEIWVRMKNRVKIGVRADQLKYGKGVKEEADRQNVFLGKCWQLPYCRKFVRERCPIYHSKRTCWKEKTGCMCEEEVIRNAMENKPIPREAVLAAKMIPRNFRLSEVQKIERCKNCVIYNEHQRHKYKLIVYALVPAFIAVYGALHGPLIDATQALVDRLNGIVHGMTLSSPSKFEAPSFFMESLLFVMMLVVLSYSLKVVEYLIFKLKV